MKVRKAKIKKPRFFLPYFLSAILLLILSAGAAVIYVMPKYYEYEYDLETDMYSKEEELFTSFKERLSEEELSISEINYQRSELIKHYCETGQRCEVEIAGNVENRIKLDSSRTAILIYYQKAPDDEYDIRFLRLADNKYLKYFDTPEIKATAYYENTSFPAAYERDSMIAFTCSKYYADYENGLFIPVEAEIVNWHGDGTGIIVKIDADNTEGFTYVEENLALIPYTTATIAGHEAKDVEGDIKWHTEECGNLYHAFEFKLSPMKEIHFYDNFKYKIDFAIVLICCGAFIFAFIPATIIYNTRKRRYEIFEYRRKTVDAMAHDLKTPMAAISAYAENLSNNIATDKKEYYAGKIEDKVAQMNKMVNDILEFSKSENSSAVIRKEEIDIADVIENIISDNDHLIAERGLKINFGKKSVKIKTDINLFRMAVANLINNAVLYSKEGTKIDITCDEKNLIIINSSEDISDEVSDLKDPFVKGSSSRGKGGTGLGLAIANNNLAMLGFKLDIQKDNDKFIATVKLK